MSQQKLTPSQLIRLYREQLGMNQSELARRIGVTPQAVQHWEQKNTSPRSSLIPVIAQVLGVEPRDLALGSPLRGLVADGVSEVRYPVGARRETKSGSPKRIGATKRVEVMGSDILCDGPLTNSAVTVAGGVHIQHLYGENKKESCDVELIVVSPEWVSTRLPGRDPGKIRLLEIYGDAMHPTLASGDWVFVDVGKQALDFDAIWALRHRATAEIWIRRVQRKLDGGWSLIWDNPKYPPVAISAEEQRQHFDVVGQVAMRGNMTAM